jgi:hypothetical protein
MNSAVRTTEGSLYELVARGNKDVFFFNDLGDSKFLFDNSYTATQPFLEDMRRIPPRTAAEFGRTVDFDFDLIGDLMRNPTLLITLPTWLPPTIAPLAQTSIITDTAGVTYGYTRAIAYFLFESIQIYQDNLLLQECSGDALWAYTLPQGTYAHSFVTKELTGDHDGSPLAIARNAAPPMLRLELPMIGTQTPSDPGFPQRALTLRSYRLRLKLRNLQDIVESSDLASTAKPAPWGRSDFLIKTSATAEPQPFSTLNMDAMAPLLLQLETRQVYIPREFQRVLQLAKQQIPFHRLYENVFTQGPLDYTGVKKAGTSLVNRRLDGRHPTGRFIWFFRGKNDINANRLWKISTGSASATAAAPTGTSLTGSYYNTISLIIAGQQRELPQSPLVWRDINNYAKEEIDTGTQLATMNWTIRSDQPTGTINMTTADRPTFYINLTNPLTEDYTELRVIVDSWGVFETDGGGRGELMSLN